MKNNQTLYPTIRWLVLLLLIILVIPSKAQKAGDTTITANYKNLSLFEVLEDVCVQTQLRIISKNEWIDSLTVNTSFENIKLDSAFTLILKNTNLTFAFFQDDLILFLRQSDSRNVGEAFEDLILIFGDPINVGRYKTATLTGKVFDGKTSEPLTGAVVYNQKTGKGSSTNASGEFELEMPTGDNLLQLSFMGFQPTMQKIRMIESGEAEFELFEETHNLEEVTIIAEDVNSSRTQMSMVKMNAQVLKKLPVLMGESDVIKSIVNMPGVQSVGELASGFNVRGGNTDQNLTLLDGSPVFNTSHLFGFLSMINPDLLSDIRLYKGGVPARFGERVSSVMEVDLKEGNDKTIKAYGGLGLINSRLTIDGPLTKNKKLNLIAGGRTSYTNWILKKIPDENISRSVTNFYDVSGKITYNFDLYNKISLMAYASNDEFSTSAQSINEYGNQLFNLKLNNKFNDNLNGELNLSYSKYAFKLTDYADSNQVEAYYLKNQIQYNSFKYHFSWQPHVKHNIQFGINGIYYISDPGEILPYSENSVIYYNKLNREKALESAIYLSDEFNILPNLILNVGLRYSRYSLLGPSTVFLYDSGKAKTPDTVIDSLQYAENKFVKTYGGIEPRLSLNYEMSNGYSLKMSYQRIQQYFNQVSNNAVISPAETWKAADYYLKPLINNQVALGISSNSLISDYNFSAEVYYKDLQNLIEYKNGAQLIMNTNLETDLIPADGYSYGLELSLNKSKGRLTGWLNYSYSRTMRQTTGTYSEEQINRGDYYPSVYDKPHDLSLVATYNISRRWRVSGNYVFMSGRPITLPEQTYTYGGQRLVYFSDRNKYRMPPYHRLDLSITFDENLRRKRMWKGSWTFSVYNVYGRNNPYSVYYKKAYSLDGPSTSAYSLFKLYIIGIPVPSITYNFTF